jgi:hypothetical protein
MGMAQQWTPVMPNRRQRFFRKKRKKQPTANVNVRYAFQGAAFSTQIYSWPMSFLPQTSTRMFSLKSSPMCCWKANTSKKLETVFIIAFPIQLQHDSQPSAPSVPFPISSVRALNGLLELRKTEILLRKAPVVSNISCAGRHAEKETQPCVHFDTTSSILVHNLYSFSRFSYFTGHRERPVKE